MRATPYAYSWKRKQSQVDALVRAANRVEVCWPRDVGIIDFGQCSLDLVSSGLEKSVRRQRHAKDERVGRGETPVLIYIKARPD